MIMRYLGLGIGHKHHKIEIDVADNTPIILDEQEPDNPGRPYNDENGEDGGDDGSNGSDTEGVDDDDINLNMDSDDDSLGYDDL